MLNRLKKYNDFIFENILTESVIFYDNRFFDILSKISKMNDTQWNTIATNKSNGVSINITREDVQELCNELLSMAHTDNSSNILLIDINDNNTLSFTRANSIKSQEDKEILMNIESNPSNDSLMDLKNLLKDKPRESIRIGKFIKALGLNYPQVVVDELIKRIQNYNKDFNDVSKYKLSVVSGDEIPHWYSIDNCISKDYKDNVDKLHDTCMVKVDSEYFDLYKDNPNSVQLIIVTLGNKLVSRALIWKTDKGMFVDDIYSSNQAGLDKINKFIISGNYNIDKNVDMIVHLENVPDLDYKFPFLDTFCYLDIEKNILSNKDLNSVKIQDDLGGFAVKIDGIYIKSDSIEYGITTSGTKGFIKKSKAVYSKELQTYIDDDIIVETDDDEIYHIYSDEVIKLDVDLYEGDEYIIKSESIKDYNGRIIDKEDVSYALITLDTVDSNGYLSMEESVVMNLYARRSENFIDASTLAELSWYKHYVKFFGNFDYISSDVISNISDNYILNKYSNVEFVNYDNEIITKDIADSYGLKYDEVLYGFDIFDIFDKMKKNGHLINISIDDIVNRIDKQSDTYNMLKDVSNTKKTLLYKKQKLD